MSYYYYKCILMNSVGEGGLPFTRESSHFTTETKKITMEDDDIK